MTPERKDEILSMVFESDKSEEEILDWIEKQPDKIEIEKLIIDSINLFADA